MIFCLSASYKSVKLPLLESLAFKDEAEALKSAVAACLIRRLGLTLTGKTL